MHIIMSAYVLVPVSTKYLHVLLLPLLPNLLLLYGYHICAIFTRVSTETESAPVRKTDQDIDHCLSRCVMVVHEVFFLCTLKVVFKVM